MAKTTNNKKKEVKKTPSKSRRNGNGLFAKEQVFADSYIIHRNATKAAAEAGYGKTKGSQGVAGNLLLKNPKVWEYIQSKTNQIASRYEITQELVLQELAAIGFSDMQNYVNPNVDIGIELTPLDKIDTHHRRAIQSVSNNKNGVSIKLYDKVNALVKLGENLGMWKAGFDPLKDGGKQDNAITHTIVIEHR